MYEKGVWNTDDRLFLEMSDKLNPGTHHIAGQTEEHKAGVWVPLTTIDSIMDELHLARLDFIKMDIAGAELKALSGAKRTLTTLRPRVGIATEHTDDIAQNTVQVIDLLQRLVPAYRFVATHGQIVPSAGGKQVFSPFVLVGNTL